METRLYECSHVIVVSNDDFEVSSRSARRKTLKTDTLNYFLQIQELGPERKSTQRICLTSSAEWVAYEEWIISVDIIETSEEYR